MPALSCYRFHVADSVVKTILREHKIPLPAKAEVLPASLCLDDVRFLHNHAVHRFTPQPLPQFDLRGSMQAPEHRRERELGPSFM